MLVARTGWTVNVLVPVAGHGVPIARLLHGSAGSTTETETEHCGEPAHFTEERSDANRRRRAPEEQGALAVQVVEVDEELEEAGMGKSTLICPELESFTTGCALLG